MSLGKDRLVSKELGKFPASWIADNLHVLCALRDHIDFRIS